MLIGPASGEEEHYRVAVCGWEWEASRTYVRGNVRLRREGGRETGVAGRQCGARAELFFYSPPPRREFNLISWWCGFASRAPDDDEWFAVHAAGSGSNNKYAYAFSS